MLKIISVSAFSLYEKSLNLYVIICHNEEEVYASYPASNGNEAVQMFKCFMLGYDQATDDEMGSPKRAQINTSSGDIVKSGDMGIL